MVCRAWQRGHQLGVLVIALLPQTRRATCISLGRLLMICSMASLATSIIIRPSILRFIEPETSRIGSIWGSRDMAAICVNASVGPVAEAHTRRAWATLQRGARRFHIESCR